MVKVSKMCVRKYYAGISFIVFVKNFPFFEIFVVSLGFAREGN